MAVKEKTESGDRKNSAPEKLRYSRYYEHDGALKAYANRAMVLAFLCVPTALIAMGMAAYVRLQPPTVIRVDGSGEAGVIAPKPSPSKESLVVTRGADAEPSDFEKRAFIHNFLDRYLNFSPQSVDMNWTEALNAMTANLRHAALAAMQKDNTVGRIQDEDITSVFHLRSLEPMKDDPLSFTIFGAKEIHRVRDHRESTEKLVAEYHIRLITERRTENNPSGLLIADYGEKLIDGEKQETAAQIGSNPGSN